jgi:hypothetical protein
MKVRDLIELLKDAPQDSVVLFIDGHAGAHETDEIRHVDIQPNLWTYETGNFGGEAYELRYPGPPDPRLQPGYTDIVRRVESVVVLSSGLTNLRYS